MRLAVSEAFRAAPREVRRWSFADCLAAHATLDHLDLMSEIARRKVPTPPVTLGEGG